MQTYIVLSRFRDQWGREMSDWPRRSEAGRRAAEAMGCRPVGSWLTLGSYDRVLIIEAPDDITMAKVSVALSVRGYESTTTLRAFAPSKAAEILSSASASIDGRG